MELREPKRKRVGSHIKVQQPLPIMIECEHALLLGNGLSSLYIGNFSGDSVVVCNPEDMKALYTMGFFGKGSFSRGYPSFGLTKKGIPPVIKERQWQRRKSWIEKFKISLTNSLKQVHDDSRAVYTETIQEKENQSNTIKKFRTDNESVTKDDVSENDNGSVEGADGSKISSDNDLEFDQFSSYKNEDYEMSDSGFSDKVLVLADSDDEDIEKVIRDPQPHIEEEQIKIVTETLKLTLEEAFFLSYGLGCLQVIDISGKSMTLKELWHTFCKVKPDFIESYVVYHYFRAKGWVVKSGFKFGGDFLLYKQGPPFYHASYVVLVEKVDSQLRRLKNSLTWTKLHGLNRLAESSGKDIIICQVIFPANITAEELETPKTLPKFRVHELLTRRWISSQERVEKEQTYD